MILNILVGSGVTQSSVHIIRYNLHPHTYLTMLLVPTTLI